MRWLCGLGALGWAAAVVAASTITPAALMQQLASVPESRRAFVETRTSALLKAPLVLTGELVYRRPDHLEKHVQSPYRESAIIDGTRLTIERADNGTRRAIEVPPGSARALIEGLRATLAGDLVALERHFVVAADADGDGWRLTLTPRTPEVSSVVARVVFVGAGSEVKRIEVVETSGDSTVTVLREAGR